MSNKKIETVSIGQYLVAKNGKTKYLKLEANPKADDVTKQKVLKVIEALGTDRIFVNLFDQDFKGQHNIPDFVKGRISIPKDTQNENSNNSDDEVNF